LPFQDVAKAGLKFGDEGRRTYFRWPLSWCLISVTDEEEEDSKEAQKKLEEKFKPLLEWLTEETKDVVRSGEYIRTTRFDSLLTIAF